MSTSLSRQLTLVALLTTSVESTLHSHLHRDKGGQTFLARALKRTPLKTPRFCSGGLASQTGTKDCVAVVVGRVAWRHRVVVHTLDSSLFKLHVSQTAVMALGEAEAAFGYWERFF